MSNEALADGSAPPSHSPSRSTVSSSRGAPIGRLAPIATSARAARVSAWVSFVFSNQDP